MYHRHTLVANRFSTFEFDDRCSIIASLIWLHGHRCDEVAELWPWCMPWCSKWRHGYLAIEVSPQRLLQDSARGSPMHWIHGSRCRCIIRTDTTLTRQGAVCLRCCMRIRLTIFATRVLNQYGSHGVASLGWTFAAFVATTHEAVVRHERSTLVALCAHRRADCDNRLIIHRQSHTIGLSQNDDTQLVQPSTCWCWLWWWFWPNTSNNIWFVIFDVRCCIRTQHHMQQPYARYRRSGPGCGPTCHTGTLYEHSQNIACVILYDLQITK